MNVQTLVPAVDNSDWLKTAAITMVVVGHIGSFFIIDASWWSVFGRMAAPIFFFLMGYAWSQTIPFRWIWLGVVLTLLDSWNNDWRWLATNILLSMVFIRIARPYVLLFLQNYGWYAFVLLVCTLLLVLPVATRMVEYGVEGWLWALFGLCHRMYVDDKGLADRGETDHRTAPTANAVTQNWVLMRLLACTVAAVVYAWQEQLEFLFSQTQLAIVVLSLVVLSIGLCVFTRGPSRFQPPQPAARALRFLGRHTLEIYVIQLAASELIIMLRPDLAA